MVEIVFDTNFCLVPFQFKVDVFDEIARIMEEPYEIVVPNLVVHELIKLKQGEAALRLLRMKGVKFVEIEKIDGVDDSILAYALKKRAIIATNDTMLKRKARKAGLRVICLRQRSHLIMI